MNGPCCSTICRRDDLAYAAGMRDASNSATASNAEITVVGELEGDAAGVIQSNGRAIFMINCKIVALIAAFKSHITSLTRLGGIYNCCPRVAPDFNCIVTRVVIVDIVVFKDIAIIAMIEMRPKRHASVYIVRVVYFIASKIAITA